MSYCLKVPIQAGVPARARDPTWVESWSNAMASYPCSFPQSFFAVPRGHHAAVIILGDLMVRKLQAHGYTTLGLRLGSDKGVQVHTSLDELSCYSSS